MKNCKNCNEVISDRKVTGLCNTCRIYSRRKRHREKLKKAHICIECRNKVEPVIKKYIPVRCEECRNKQKAWREEYGT